MANRLRSRRGYAGLPRFVKSHTHSPLDFPAEVKEVDVQLARPLKAGLKSFARIGALSDAGRSRGHRADWPGFGEGD